MKDVTTIFNPLTEKVALFLLHLGMVVSQASNLFPDQLIMLSYGLFFEGTTVQEPLPLEALGGGVPTSKSSIYALTEGGSCLMEWVTILW